ncbi:MAG: birA [Chlamydiia bacterium]|nr:birA [Chlamydiia bacterium]
MKTTYYHFPTVDSTNAFAKKHITSLSPDEIAVITADEQTQGTGRQKRLWIAPKGKNLLLTLAFPNRGLHPFFFSQLAGLCIQELIAKSKIKWPNDVLIHDKKIAGILTETSDNKVILGIGVNLNMTQEELLQIPKAVTSIFLETGKEQDLISFRNAFIASFLLKFEQAKIDGPLYFQHEWREHLSWMISKEITVADAGKIISGTILAIRLDGSLELELTDKTKILIFSGDLV